MRPAIAEAKEYRLEFVVTEVRFSNANCDQEC